MNDTRTKKKSPKKASKKQFKYQRECKLPSCRKPFGTNRHWQDFHSPQCQTDWHKYLKRSKEELAVSIMILEAEVKKIKRKLRMKTKGGGHK